MATSSQNTVNRNDSDLADSNIKAIKYVEHVILWKGPMSTKHLIGYFGMATYAIREAVGFNESGLQDFLKSNSRVFKVAGADNMVDLVCPNKVNKVITESNTQRVSPAMETEAVGYFYNKLLTKGPIPVTSLQGHYNQATNDVRKTIGGGHLALFIDFLKRNPDKFKMFIEQDVVKVKPIAEQQTSIPLQQNSATTVSVTASVSKRDSSSDSEDERTAIDYFRNILLKKGPVKITTLQGHLSQAPINVHLVSGGAFVNLANFLKRHPNIFYVSGDPGVEIVQVKICESERTTSRNVLCDALFKVQISDSSSLPVSHILSTSQMHDELLSANLKEKIEVILKALRNKGPLHLRNLVGYITASDDDRVTIDHLAEIISNDDQFLLASSQGIVHMRSEVEKEAVDFLVKFVQAQHNPVKLDDTVEYCKTNASHQVKELIGSNGDIIQKLLHKQTYIRFDNNCNLFIDTQNNDKSSPKKTQSSLFELLTKLLTTNNALTVCEIRACILSLQSDLLHFDETALLKIIKADKHFLYCESDATVHLAETADQNAVAFLRESIESQGPITLSGVLLASGQHLKSASVEVKQLLENTTKPLSFSKKKLKTFCSKHQDEFVPSYNAIYFHAAHLSPEIKAVSLVKSILQHQGPLQIDALSQYSHLRSESAEVRSILGSKPDAVSFTKDALQKLCAKHFVELTICNKSLCLTESCSAKSDADLDNLELSLLVTDPKRQQSSTECEPQVFDSLQMSESFLSEFVPNNNVACKLAADQPGEHLIPDNKLISKHSSHARVTNSEKNSVDEVTFDKNGSPQMDNSQSSLRDFGKSNMNNLLSWQLLTRSLGLADIQNNLSDYPGIIKRSSDWLQQNASLSQLSFASHSHNNLQLKNKPIQVAKTVIMPQEDGQLQYNRFVKCSLAPRDKLGVVISVFNNTVYAKCHEIEEIVEIHPMNCCKQLWNCRELGHHFVIGDQLIITCDSDVVSSVSINSEFDDPFRLQQENVFECCNSDAVIHGRGKVCIMTADYVAILLANMEMVSFVGKCRLDALALGDLIHFSAVRIRAETHGTKWMAKNIWLPQARSSKEPRPVLELGYTMTVLQDIQPSALTIRSNHVGCQTETRSDVSITSVEHHTISCQTWATGNIISSRHFAAV